MFPRVLAFLGAFAALSRCQFDKGIGDACRNGGTCKLLDDCPVEQKLLATADNDVVNICGYTEDFTVIVCCEQRGAPPPKPLANRISQDLSISEKKCEEYAKYVFAEVPSLTLASTAKKTDLCFSNVEELINGGKPARPREFPHIAEIGYGRAPTVTFQCGGSLISERWVMSAAHCSYVENLGPPRLARIGDLNNTSENDGARPVVVNIVKIVSHPDYNEAQIYDDIALFQLEKDVVLSPYVRPICLQVNHRIEYQHKQLTMQHHYATAIGFGHVHFGGDYHNFLQKVDLNFVDFKKCNETYGKSSRLSDGINNTKMLCAGDKAGEDTCKGDSGSSLLVKLDHPYCMYSQVGITSFGRYCGRGIPGVYTRVSHYVPWIEKIVWPGENR